MIIDFEYPTDMIPGGLTLIHFASMQEQLATKELTEGYWCNRTGEVNPEDEIAHGFTSVILKLNPDGSIADMIGDGDGAGELFYHFKDSDNRHGDWFSHDCMLALPGNKNGYWLASDLIGITGAVKVSAKGLVDHAGYHHSDSWYLQLQDTPSNRLDGNLGESDWTHYVTHGKSNLGKPAEAKPPKQAINRSKGKRHDQATKDRVYQLRENGVSINKLVLLTGVSKRTIQNWLKAPNIGD